MAQEPTDRETIRKYLLAELDEPQRQALEERLVSDDAVFEELQVVEDELIDDYLKDKLDEEQKSRFESVFLTTAERRNKLRFGRNFMNYVSSQAAKKPSTRIERPRPKWWSQFASPPRIAVYAVVIVGIAVATWLAFFRQSDINKGLIALNHAYRQQRPIEARISQFDYAPFSVTRGGEPERVDSLARDRAERVLLDAVHNKPSAEAYHALGKLNLAKKDFDRAIERFDQALKADPNNAQIYADLGAAYLERGKLEVESGNLSSTNSEAGKGLEDLGLSLENLNKALQINNNLIEALFNKALCLQYMRAPEQAKEAWQNYLVHDSQSSWAAEAKRYLEILSTRSASSQSVDQLLESFIEAFNTRDDGRAWKILSENREPITGKMIAPRLARRYISLRSSAHEERAQESLRAFQYAGELEEQRGSDPYTSELASYYGALPIAQRRLLSEAIENLDQGYRSCLDTKYSEAAKKFELARNLFNRAGNAQEMMLADYWIAYCLTQTDQIKEGITQLKAVSEFCKRKGYKWLLAQAYGWLGINYSILSEHSEAIKYYELSLALSQAISDSYQMQKVLTELGSEYAGLRQPQLSLGYFYRSVALGFQSNQSPRQSWRNFSYATAALFSFKHYEAAAAFANEALILGKKEFNDPSLNYMLYLNLGQIYSKLERFDEAVHQSELGLQTAYLIQDKPASRKLIAYALVHLAQTWREASSCDRATGYYDQALQLYEQMEFDVFRYEAYKGRLLCSLALKHEAQIQQDLSSLLQLYERQRSLIREEQNRNSFFDTEQDAYDIAINYEYERHNNSGAIDYSEKARARSLLDALESGGRVEKRAAGRDMVFSKVSNPLDLAQVSNCLASQAQIVMYSVLPSKLLIWKISRDDVSSFEENISAETLEADVLKYVDAMTKSKSEAQNSSRALGMKLFEILLAKVGKTLAPGQKLSIIPDKFLYYLPFAALPSPETGRYLVEDWAVSYSPSLNVLCHCSERAQAKSGVDLEVLTIGNPTFNRRSYPNLPGLQAAAHEAKTVADIYGSPTCLTGPQATKKNILMRLSSADIIHFAGHYVIDESHPMLSKMMLAAADDSGDSEDHLRAFEILEHRFDRTKLIVLSACQTGIEKHYRGEGAIGLSRTFIAAGVPLVVASQWPVESDSTAELMINFHRSRHLGRPSAEALREAQLDMLRGPDEKYRLPYYWAAFQCVGGCTEY